MIVFQKLRAVFAVSALSTALLIAEAPQVIADEGKAEEAMQNFNHAMLSILRRSQDEVTANTRPVMLIARDVTVVSEGGEKTYPRVGPRYDQLKSVSHVLLGIIGAVTPWPESETEKARLIEDFTTIKAEIKSFLAAIDGLGLPEDMLASQRDMLRTAETFVDKVLEKGDLTQTEVTQAINDMRPVWAANMRGAVRVELQALHKAVTAAREGLNEDEWGRLYVVSHGGPNVRAINVVQQYLQRVMPEKVAAGQVLFAESIRGKDAMIKHVGYARMQRIVGAWAFGDPKRMEVDLLGYEAGSVLDEIIPVAPPQAPDMQ